MAQAASIGGWKQVKAGYRPSHQALRTLGRIQVAREMQAKRGGDNVIRGTLLALALGGSLVLGSLGLGVAAEARSNSQHNPSLAACGSLRDEYNSLNTEFNSPAATDQSNSETFALIQGVFGEWNASCAARLGSID